MWGSCMRASSSWKGTQWARWPGVGLSHPCPLMLARSLLRSVG